MENELRNKAIKRLKENKENSNQFNYFGEDNHKRIDIMIDVIENNRTEDFIYKKYQSEFDDGEEDTIGHGNWVSAMNALEFVKGKIKLEDLLYPEI